MFFVARVLVVAALSIAVLDAAGTALAQNSGDALADGFRSPPDAAKPRTWWHWTNGNVTESGITKDLEWMKRSGIGGFQLADVSAGSGQTVEQKINFGTPEWYHAVRHSAEEAKRLGLEMSIFSSPGWSEAGGPWVKPEQAMKKLVWSEIETKGGAHVDLKLPQPPSIEGPVRDLTVDAKTAASPGFYTDSAVIAYRTPAVELDAEALHPKLTSSSGEVDAAALLDNSLNTTARIAPAKEGGPAWLQFEFTKPCTIRAFTIGSPGGSTRAIPGGTPVGRLLASDDGKSYRVVIDTPGPQGYHGAAVRTFAFAPVTARFFRYEIDGVALTPAAIVHGGVPIPAPEYVLSEAILHAGARVNRWEDKGAFGSLMDIYDIVPTPDASSNAAIAGQDVINLTGKMDADGTLHWDAPTGRWTILRMGYSLTGAKNRPATKAGSGYEVDKLNPEYVRSYFRSYMDPIQQQMGEAASSTLSYMTMDSWEAGMQNWTAEMIAEFRRRRGYDPTTYLPVLAGRVVTSSEVSDRFLWDFRRTLADMFADNFYGTMEDELKRHGMKSYAEASGVALEIPEDTLLNKSKVDIPMAEFWVKALHPESMYYVDVRGAASAAHIYGKQIVATESYTGGGYESPYTLKKIADYWFAQGVNRLVFHSTAQQPLDTKPGNTMVGAHIHRNITWAEQAKPLMTYFARISYLLQEGNAVADLAYLLPEGAPSTMPFWGSGLVPAPPPGYDYDYLNTDVLLHQTSVTADGRIRLADGMSYGLLVLPPTVEMTPEVARKLHELVAAGAKILGPRPMQSPSLMGFPSSDIELQTIAGDLWADTDGVTNIQHAYGKGMVYWGLPPAEVLTRSNISQDVIMSSSLDAAPVWAHRRTNDTDIYFIANQADAPLDLDVQFRVTGRDVQLWRPMDGEMDEAAFRANDGSTTVHLQLAERESVFVVFRRSSTAPLRELPAPHPVRLATLDGAWELKFPAGMGAPLDIQLEKPGPWTDSQDTGVKYFSGTATYLKSMQAQEEWFRAETRLWLDLGDVRDIAQVLVNGKDAGIVWAPPYRVDVTKLMHVGVNHVEIRVTNEWSNRLYGDSLLPKKDWVLSGGSPLRGGGWFGGKPGLAPSGLLADVTLVAERNN